MAELAILVPVYQREEGAIRAVRSVVSQAHQELSQGSLTLHVRDDASKSMDSERFKAQLLSIHPCISIDFNAVNLGMSANIRSMVLECKAAFCSILTDDDWLEPGSIDHLLSVIRRLENDRSHSVSSIFYPRYSYTESGAHACTSCRIASADVVFPSDPVTTMRLADKGYILTGLFFRPDLVDQEFWARYESNAFFPILYFASLLNRGSCIYFDKPLVHHTVFNLCHWEAWGATTQAQQERLCRDFLAAISLVYRYLKPRCRSLKDRILLWPPAVRAYRRGLVEMKGCVWHAPLRCIPKALWLEPRFLIAFSGFLYFSVRTRSGRPDRMSFSSQ